jgi:hypothetical protein
MQEKHQKELTSRKEVVVFRNGEVVLRRILKLPMLSLQGNDCLPLEAPSFPSALSIQLILTLHIQKKRKEERNEA